MVSVDVKHRVYLFTAQTEGAVSPDTGYQQLILFSIWALVIDCVLVLTEE